MRFSARHALRAVRRRFLAAGAGTGVALRALWANRLRATLTTLGIVIGVATVIGILSVIQGLNRSFDEQLASLGARSLYISQMPWIMEGDAWFLLRNRPPITEWQYRRLREQVPFAAAISPSVEEHAKVEANGEKLTDVHVRGTNAEYVLVGGEDVERGRFLSAVDVALDRPFAVLGSEVASKLFGRSDPLLRTVDIRDRRYTVVGVMKPRGSFLGRSQDNFVIVPLGCFLRAFGQWRSLTIGVKVIEGFDLAEAKEELRGLMRGVRGLRPAERDNFDVNEQKALSDMYDRLTAILYGVIFGVSLISLLVGGIGIMNIMLVSVTERTREIGIRKALGARRATVMFQFLIESLALSALGGIIGLGVGFLGAAIVDAVSPLPATPTLLAVTLGLGFAAFVGVVFGLYPAWRASRLDPIVALRYE
jgi:putative ABC transport system permease protein